MIVANDCLILHVFQVSNGETREEVPSSPQLLRVFPIVTVALGWLAHMIPSAALHAITALNIGSAQPLAFLSSPLSGITLVLASFFIGLGTAYLFSKGSGGQGTFLAHFYCLLLCTVPLVILPPLQPLALLKLGDGVTGGNGSRNLSRVRHHVFGSDTASPG